MPPVEGNVPAAGTTSVRLATLDLTVGVPADSARQITAFMPVATAVLSPTGVSTPSTPAPDLSRPVAKLMFNLTVVFFECAGSRLSPSAALRCRSRSRPIRTVTVLGVEQVRSYEPMTLASLGALLAGSDDSRRWRLVAEFLEEHRWEPVTSRAALLAQEPAGSGDERWDVFLAGLAEHLAAKDGHSAPPWAEARTLRRFWFPFNTRAARVDAVVNAPAAFRRRGVYVAAQELNVA